MAGKLMMGYRNNTFVTQMEDNAVQEAASGFQSVEKLIRLLSESQEEQKKSSMEEIDANCRAVADVAVTELKKVVSVLGRTRTGHARFRRAPINSCTKEYKEMKEEELSETRVYCPTPIQQIPVVGYYQSQAEDHMLPRNVGVTEGKGLVPKTISFSYSPTISRGNSFISSLTGETDNKPPSSSSAFQNGNLSQVSAAKPPLSSGCTKRKCNSSENGASGKCSSSSGRCHCSKRRKLRLKRVIRVPAISMKLADIPPDDFSWRKYGQKPIKGSPHPRGYYKCSSVRGCPARKHVERALDDPTMLIVTYEGQHNHSLSVAEKTDLILESS